MLTPSDKQAAEQQSLENVFRIARNPLDMPAWKALEKLEKSELSVSMQELYDAREREQAEDADMRGLR